MTTDHVEVDTEMFLKSGRKPPVSEEKTVIGTGSKVSIALIIALVSPLIALVTFTYQLKVEIVGLKNELSYIRANTWTIGDMERYRFHMQIQNAKLGINTPDVQEIVRQRTH